MSSEGLVRRAAIVASAVMGSAYVSLLSFYGPTQVALAAPLAGVVIVVALTSTPRSLGLDVAVVAAFSFATIALQVSDWRLGVVGAVTSLIQGGVVLLLYRGLGRWPGVGARGLASLADVTPLGVAVLLAAVASSAARWSGLGLIEASDLSNVVLTTVRTITWGFVLGALGLMVAAGERPLSSSVDRQRAAGPVEVVLGLGVTVVFLAATFPRSDPLPVIFPLFLVVVWASLRLRPVAAIGFSGALGVFAVTCTVMEVGSFAEVADARVGAALSQAFLLCLVVVATALSLSVRDRERATAALLDAVQETRRRARERDLVLSNLAEGVVLFRPDGRILLRNEAGRGIVGGSRTPGPDYPPSSEELGLRAADGDPVPPDYLRQLVSSSGTTPHEVTVSVHRPDGSSRIIEARAVRAGPPDPTKVDPGSAGRVDVEEGLVVATFRDVTEQHERTAELTAFAGVVAHDLARPLTLITGWAELLESMAPPAADGSPGHLHQFSSRILSAAEGMRSLLDDLLTLTLARDRELRLTDVDVSGLCQAWATAQAAPDDAVGDADGATPVITVQPGIVVCGDEALLRQTFENLLANAVKYVAPGVAPRVSVSSTQDDGRLVVRVADNGIGIPLAERGRVFDEFYRSTRGRDDFPGTGIGLAICRRVAERHGGGIRAIAGPEDIGTCVEVTFPAPPPAIRRGPDDTEPT